MTRNALVAFVEHALFAILVSCSALAPQARAQSTGYAFDAEPEYDVGQQPRTWLRALLDVRAIRAGSAPSWTDSGPGKTRYGGERTGTGFERETRLALAQLALEVGAALPWNIRAQAQINVQPDLDDGRPWLTEADLRREWGGNENGWSLQAGLMNPPFSLERTGPAWTPEYTISSSELDSWMWEEISLAGVEGEWWHDTRNGMRLGMLVGAGFGPDHLGRLVAVRGWSTGDVISGLNGELPLPSGERMEIFDERDHRPAGYAWLTLGDTDERATVRLGFFDNFGDEEIAGVWNTHFAVLGATVHPRPSIAIVAQYLRGEARVRYTTNDSSLRAYYALLSHQRGRHRFSIRYDSFRVNDVDGGSSTREHGEGVTFAWLLQMGLRHRIGVEYVWLDSRRPAGAVPEPSQDGWQLSYRFRY